MQIVHVIPAAGKGDRHEERFPDDFAPQQILDAFGKPRNKGEAVPLQFGYGLIKEKPEDEVGVPYLDHPETRVVIGKSVNKEFVEIQTIQGPDPTTKKP